MLTRQIGLSPDSISIQSADSVSLNKMPDVTGMGARTALYALRERGLQVTLKGRGRVTDQSKEAGTPVKRGEQVQLTLEWSD